MESLVTAKRESVATICRAHHVTRLAVFGSAVRDDFNAERSDVDVVVVFDDIPVEGYAANFFDFQRQLEHLFARPVDVLTQNSIKNPYLRRAIETDQVLLYAA